eukprot:TRINITY_DN38231_c0_g7_i1.p1 TRINITY_DN38231_c0_g7~~TRINITY_DN38231_c0_g7_i1.p1  ORF type:complete len:2929 (+),score=775.09 TRINITY_DN38231_c0_g7_i1:50-8836(+)
MGCWPALRCGWLLQDAARPDCRVEWLQEGRSMAVGVGVDGAVVSAERVSRRLDQPVWASKREQEAYARQQLPLRQLTEEAEMAEALEPAPAQRSPRRVHCGTASTLSRLDLEIWKLQCEQEEYVQQQCKLTELWEEFAHRHVASEPVSSQSPRPSSEESTSGRRSSPLQARRRMVSPKLDPCSKVGSPGYGGSSSSSSALRPLPVELPSAQKLESVLQASSARRAAMEEQDQLRARLDVLAQTAAQHAVQQGVESLGRSPDRRKVSPSRRLESGSGDRQKRNSDRGPRSRSPDKQQKKASRNGSVPTLTTAAVALQLPTRSSSQPDLHDGAWARRLGSPAAASEPLSAVPSSDTVSGKEDCGGNFSARLQAGRPTAAGSEDRRSSSPRAQALRNRLQNVASGGSTAGGERLEPSSSSASLSAEPAAPVAVVLEPLQPPAHRAVTSCQGDVPQAGFGGRPGDAEPFESDVRRRLGDAGAGLGRQSDHTQAVAASTNDGSEEGRQSGAAQGSQREWPRSTSAALSKVVTSQQPTAAGTNALEARAEALRQRLSRAAACVQSAALSESRHSTAVDHDGLHSGPDALEADAEAERLQLRVEKLQAAAGDVAQELAKARAEVARERAASTSCNVTAALSAAVGSSCTPQAASHRTDGAHIISGAAPAGSATGLPHNDDELDGAVSVDTLSLQMSMSEATTWPLPLAADGELHCADAAALPLPLVSSLSAGACERCGELESRNRQDLARLESASAAHCQNLLEAVSWQLAYERAQLPKPDGQLQANDSRRVEAKPLERALAAAEERLGHLERRLEEVSLADEKEAATQIRELTSCLSAANQSIVKAEADGAASMAQSRMMEAQLAQLNSCLSDCQEKLLHSEEKASVTLSLADAEHGALRSALQVLETRDREASQHSNEAAQKKTAEVVADLQGRLTASEDKVSALQTVAAQQEAAVSDEMRHLMSALSSLRRHDEELEKASEQVAAAEAEEMHRLHAELHDADEHLLHAQEDLHVHEEEASSQLLHLRKKLERAESAGEDMMRQVAALEQRFESEVTGRRMVPEEAQSPHSLEVEQVFRTELSQATEVVFRLEDEAAQIQREEGKLTEETWQLAAAYHEAEEVAVQAEAEANQLAEENSMQHEGLARLEEKARKSEALLVEEQRERMQAHHERDELKQAARQLAAAYHDAEETALQAEEEANQLAEENALQHKDLSRLAEKTRESEALLREDKEKLKEEVRQLAAAYHEAEGVALQSESQTNQLAEENAMQHEALCWLEEKTRESKALLDEEQRNRTQVQHEGERLRQELWQLAAKYHDEEEIVLQMEGEANRLAAENATQHDCLLWLEDKTRASDGLLAEEQTERTQLAAEQNRHQREVQEKEVELQAAEASIVRLELQASQVGVIALERERCTEKLKDAEEKTREVQRCNAQLQDEGAQIVLESERRQQALRDLEVQMRAAQACNQELEDEASQSDKEMTRKEQMLRHAEHRLQQIHTSRAELEEHLSQRVTEAERSQEEMRQMELKLQAVRASRAELEEQESRLALEGELGQKELWRMQQRLQEVEESHAELKVHENAVVSFQNEERQAAILQMEQRLREVQASEATLEAKARQAVLEAKQWKQEMMRTEEQLRTAQSTGTATEGWAKQPLLEIQRRAEEAIQMEEKVREVYARNAQLEAQAKQAASWRQEEQLALKREVSLEQQLARAEALECRALEEKLKPPNGSKKSEVSELAVRLQRTELQDLLTAKQELMVATSQLRDELTDAQRELLEQRKVTEQQELLAQKPASAHERRQTVEDRVTVSTQAAQADLKVVDTHEQAYINALQDELEVARAEILESSIVAFTEESELHDTLQVVHEAERQVEWQEAQTSDMRARLSGVELAAKFDAQVLEHETELMKQECAAYESQVERLRDRLAVAASTSPDLPNSAGAADKIAPWTQHADSAVLQGSAAAVAETPSSTVSRAPAQDDCGTIQRLEGELQVAREALATEVELRCQARATVAADEEQVVALLAAEVMEARGQAKLLLNEAQAVSASRRAEETAILPETMPVGPSVARRVEGVAVAVQASGQLHDANGCLHVASSGDESAAAAALELDELRTELAEASRARDLSKDLFDDLYSAAHEASDHAHEEIEALHEELEQARLEVHSTPLNGSSGRFSLMSVEKHVDAAVISELREELQESGRRSQQRGLETQELMQSLEATEELVEAYERELLFAKEELWAVQDVATVNAGSKAVATSYRQEQPWRQAEAAIVDEDSFEIVAATFDDHPITKESGGASDTEEQTGSGVRPTDVQSNATDVSSCQPAPCATLRASEAGEMNQVLDPHVDGLLDALHAAQAAEMQERRRADALADEAALLREELASALARRSNGDEPVSASPLTPNFGVSLQLQLLQPSPSPDLQAIPEEDGSSWPQPRVNGHWSQNEAEELGLETASNREISPGATPEVDNIAPSSTRTDDDGDLKGDTANFAATMNADVEATLARLQSELMATIEAAQEIAARASAAEVWLQAERELRLKTEEELDAEKARTEEIVPFLELSKEVSQRSSQSEIIASDTIKGLRHELAELALASQRALEDFAAVGADATSMRQPARRTPPPLPDCGEADDIALCAAKWRAELEVERQRRLETAQFGEEVLRMQRHHQGLLDQETLACGRLEVCLVQLEEAAAADGRAFRIAAENVEGRHAAAMRQAGARVEQLEASQQELRKELASTKRASRAAMRQAMHRHEETRNSFVESQGAAAEVITNLRSEVREERSRRGSLSASLASSVNGSRRGSIEGDDLAGSLAHGILDITQATEAADSARLEDALRRERAKAECATVAAQEAAVAVAEVEAGVAALEMDAFERGRLQARQQLQGRVAALEGDAFQRGELAAQQQLQALEGQVRQLLLVGAGAWQAVAMESPTPHRDAGP